MLLLDLFEKKLLYNSVLKYALFQLSILLIVGVELIFTIIFANVKFVLFGYNFLHGVLFTLLLLIFVDNSLLLSKTDF